MPTPLKFSRDFPGTVESARALLTDVGFIQQVLTESESLNPHVSVTDQAHGFVQVQIDREFRGDWPPLVASLVGETIHISETRTYVWKDDDSSLNGTLELRVSGQPVTMSGTLKVTPSAEGIRLEVAGDIKASIPFVAGKIEGLVLDQILAGIALESDLLAQKL